MIDRDHARAIIWTLVWPLVVVVIAGLTMFGDCAEDVFTGTHQGTCVDQTRMIGWIVVGLGIAVYTLGCWVIFRKRGR